MEEIITNASGRNVSLPPFTEVLILGTVSAPSIKPAASLTRACEQDASTSQHRHTRQRHLLLVDETRVCEVSSIRIESQHRQEITCRTGDHEPFAMQGEAAHRAGGDRGRRRKKAVTAIPEILVDGAVRQQPCSAHLIDRRFDPLIATVDDQAGGFVKGNRRQVVGEISRDRTSTTPSVPKLGSSSPLLAFLPRPRNFMMPTSCR
ncbi:hypothetical protein [Luteibacter sp. UNCMF366Tsu5.1]|uniref:hypothetical protein n=1 Tax=Luteibacter sp. UNCMF366Tsu5.1 TaxID=1502758 RepID=UPI0015A69565|nr:hypothetical protein [Luteibacter sp. UNCMF366Tsu5.1]